MGATFPGNSVFDSRTQIIDETSLPAVVVFGTDETVNRDEGYMGPAYQRELTIRVEFQHAGVDGKTIADTLEDMLEQAETALYADTVLEAGTRDFYLATVDVEISSEPGDTRMLLGANFTAEYERAG